MESKNLKKSSPGGSRIADPPPALELVRPWLVGLLTAILVARPLLPSESVAESGDGMPFVMLAILGCMAWLLMGIAHGRIKVRLGWADLAMVALLVAYSTSALSAVRNGAPRPAMNMLWEWTGMMLTYFLLRQLVMPGAETRALLAIMLGLAVSLSGLGLYQYKYDQQAARDEYYSNPDKALKNAGLMLPKGSPERALYEQRLESTEVTASFALANSLAGFLATWLVVALGIGLSTWGRSGLMAKSLLVLLLCVAAMGACLILTKSRTAWIATAAGAIVMAIGVRRTVRYPMWRMAAVGTVLGVGAIALAFFLKVVDKEVFTEAQKSLSYRFEFWQATWSMIRDNPWLGCGPGNFQDHYTLYKLPESSEVIADPHNFLLEILATAGPFALAALVAALGLGLLTVLRAGRPSAATPKPEEEPSTTIHILLGGLAGFALSMFAGLMSSMHMPIERYLLLGGVTALVALLLQPWVQNGRMPLAIPVAGAFTMLVNLLAAGGLGMPGVAFTLWTLFAVALVEANADRFSLDLPRMAAAPWLIAVVLVGTGCYLSGYLPVLKCRMAQFQADTESRRMAFLLREAAESDPLDSRSRWQLADWELTEWQQQEGRDPAGFARFERDVKEALRLRPHLSAGWRRAGEIYLQDVYPKSREIKDIKFSILALERAAELYPTHPMTQAMLSLAYFAGEKDSKAAAAGREALRLDRLTPHKDLKLPPQLRKGLAQHVKESKR